MERILVILVLNKSNVIDKICCCSVAAAAKLLQSRQTLFDPIDGSLPGSVIPGILQARTLEWVAIAFSSTTWEAHYLDGPSVITWALKDKVDQSNRKDEVEEVSPTKETKGEVRTWTLTCLTVAGLEEGGQEPWTKEYQWPCADHQWGDGGLCPATPRSWIRLAAWTWKGFFRTASGKERSPAHTLDSAWWDLCWILTYRNYEIRNLCCLKPLNLWSFFYGRKCVESINHSVVPISLQFNGL